MMQMLNEDEDTEENCHYFILTNVFLFTAVSVVYVC